MHDVSLYDFELPDITEWLAGDDRALAFKVTDGTGTGVDISDATVTWALFGREYQTDAADAVIDESDGGVEIVTDNRVDTSAGEFEVRIDGEATDDEWGEYWHRPVVEQSDGTEASWVGRVVLTA